MHTHLQQLLGLPKGEASLDPPCSERDRAGLPGWGFAVHIEKREIKNTMVLGSQAAVLQNSCKKFLFDCRDRRDTLAPKICSVLSKLLLNPGESVQVQILLSVKLLHVPHFGH